MGVQLTHFSEKKNTKSLCRFIRIKITKNKPYIVQCTRKEILECANSGSIHQGFRTRNRENAENILKQTCQCDLRALLVQSLW